MIQMVTVSSNNEVNLELVWMHIKAEENMGPFGYVHNNIFIEKYYHNKIV